MLRGAGAALVGGGGFNARTAPTDGGVNRLAALGEIIGDRLPDMGGNRGVRLALDFEQRALGVVIDRCDYAGHSTLPAVYLRLDRSMRWQVMSIYASVFYCMISHQVLHLEMNEKAASVVACGFFRKRFRFSVVTGGNPTTTVLRGHAERASEAFVLSGSATSPDTQIVSVLVCTVKGMTMPQRTIIRTPKEMDRPHFSLERAVPQDKRLSWEARGVLCYLLSQPNDWEVRIDDLKQGCGRNKVYKILDELKRLGYLKREQKQRANGTWEWGPYIVYEKPLPQNGDMGAQASEPHSSFQEVENGEINTQSSVDKESTDKEREAQSADALSTSNSKIVDFRDDSDLAPEVYRGLGMPGLAAKAEKRKASKQAALKRDDLYTHPLWQAFRNEWPDGARPLVAPHDAARYLEVIETLVANGVTPERVAALARKRLSEGKTGYSFTFVLSDIHEIPANGKTAPPAPRQPVFVAPDTPAAPAISEADARAFLAEARRKVRSA